MDIIKSSIKILIARVGKSASQFLAVVLFSRALGASPLGTYYPFIALLGIVSIPATFGLATATEKRISEGEDPERHLGTAITLRLGFVTIISIVLYVGRGYIDQFFGSELALLFIATLFAKQASDFSLNVLRGELRVGETALIEVIRPLCWLVVGYALYLEGFGVRGLIYGYLVGCILMAVVGWWKVSTGVSLPSLAHARSLLSFGKYSAIAETGGYIYSWIDVVILSLFVSYGITATRADIGAYENAWRLTLVVMLLSRSIATTVFPQFSRWESEDALKQIESVIPRATLPGLMIVIPAFAGTTILAEDLLSILFGPEFTVAALALTILAGERILQAFHSILGQVIWGINKPKLAAYPILISATVNLVLNVLLIWMFGIVGAAVATLVSSAVLLGFQIHYLRQFMEISLPIQEGAWCAVSASAMWVVVRLVYESMSVDSLLELAAIVAVGAVTYGLIIVLYKPLREFLTEMTRTALPVDSQ
ncbi:membrane protein involved in the export of O-antigen and teichoic acid [Halosimplex carlsbadense 2-9-1]|uniref:Membrane protein involved in the export of O-antigen and teichoic acid n=1 Tax=Halosimplex carlsbadense 2-9-1 TaxID=797114 RepID=M0D623_9EURY|nr:flippase [Halosimplex carlsbadense]ELZ30308.1 membrane protein involved in the export of O-antigen and teichoic acid [Halosimplex carlsbadense 2-9-1]